MNATGGTPLFDGDGTQAPLPQDLFADPLSGLLTTGAAERSTVDDYERLPIAGPVQPDMDMMSAALLAENVDQRWPERPVAIPLQSTERPVVAGRPPQGMLPQQRTWPVRTPQLPRLTRLPKARTTPQDIEEVEEAASKRGPRRIRPAKPSSSSAGVIVAVILMIIFAILAVEMLASLFSGLADMFS